jgi:hypothetical protein
MEQRLEIEQDLLKLRLKRNCFVALAVHSPESTVYSPELEMGSADYSSAADIGASRQQRPTILDFPAAGSDSDRLEMIGPISWDQADPAVTSSPELFRRSQVGDGRSELISDLSQATVRGTDPAHNQDQRGATPRPATFPVVIQVVAQPANGGSVSPTSSVLATGSADYSSAAEDGASRQQCPTTKCSIKIFPIASGPCVLPNVQSGSPAGTSLKTIAGPTTGAAVTNNKLQMAGRDSLFAFHPKGRWTL